MGSPVKRAMVLPAPRQKAKILWGMCLTPLAPGLRTPQGQRTEQIVGSSITPLPLGTLSHL